MITTGPVQLRDTLLTVAAVVVILGAARFSRDLIVPFLLSLFIAIIASVPVGWLRGRGLPAPIAVFGVLLLIIGIMALAAILVGATVEEFRAALPAYQARLSGLVSDGARRLSAYGIDVSQSGLLETLDPKTAIRFANDLMSGLGQVLSNVVLIMFTVMFMLFEGTSLPAKLQTMSQSARFTSAHRLAEVVDSTKRYIGMKTVISLGTGALIWLGTTLFGLDFAILWGFIGFLFNFVPTIGSIIAAVPAVLLALVQLGLFPAVAIAAMYAAINIGIGNFLEPNVMGARVGLAPLVVFLSLVFWGWLLGPIGMLLSVPLTMVV
ncbi:MAG: AI-2E family transporter [Gammaproteobacteria bacterium]|nr:AI-2E family transporter [Gammaproteobacteria bacterium]